MKSRPARLQIIRSERAYFLSFFPKGSCTWSHLRNNEKTSEVNKACSKSSSYCFFKEMGKYLVIQFQIRSRGDHHQGTKCIWTESHSRFLVNFYVGFKEVNLSYYECWWLVSPIEWKNTAINSWARSTFYNYYWNLHFIKRHAAFLF